MILGVYRQRILVSFASNPLTFTLSSPQNATKINMNMVNVHVYTYKHRQYMYSMTHGVILIRD